MTTVAWGPLVGQMGRPLVGDGALVEILAHHGFSKLLKISEDGGRPQWVSEEEFVAFYEVARCESCHTPLTRQMLEAITPNGYSYDENGERL